MPKIELNWYACFDAILKYQKSIYGKISVKTSKISIFCPTFNSIKDVSLESYEKDKSNLKENPKKVVRNLELDLDRSSIYLQVAAFHSAAAERRNFRITWQTDRFKTHLLVGVPKPRNNMIQCNKNLLFRPKKNIFV